MNEAAFYMVGNMAEAVAKNDKINAK
jgi:F-type H+-transporting ATPase subunit beta